MIREKRKFSHETLRRGAEKAFHGSENCHKIFHTKCRFARELRYEFLRFFP